MSAGSQTDPGGYTGAGTDDLHLTVKGKRVELDDGQAKASCSRATEQFTIDDERSPSQIAELLRTKGYDPVWKDWDLEILSPQQ